LMAGVSLDDMLSSGASLVEDMVDSGEPILVVSHYDADGLSSASIFTMLLQQLKAPFHLKIVEQLYPSIVDEVGKLGYRNIVFLDLGSGYKTLLSNIPAEKILIIDHHLSLGDVKDIVEVNPHLAGIDASKEVSAAGVTYLVYKALGGAPEAAAHLALTGALGDRQDAGPKFSLVGINKTIVEEARKLELVEYKVGLRLFGVSQRPLVRALANTFDPYLPGLTGNEAACYDFLRKIGIKPTENGKLRMYSSLTPDEIKTLATELIKYLLSKGVPLKEAERIFGYIYLYTREAPGSPFHDLREYAYMLNALGRMDRYGTALAVNMGYRGRYLVRALDAMKEYKRVLSRLLRTIEEGRSLVERDGILLYILGEEGKPKLTGPLSSLLVSSAAAAKVKLVGVAAPVDDSHLKVSFRRVKEEVDIGSLLQKVSAKLNAYGGGHPAAGGILIEKGQVDSLVEALAENHEV